MTGYEQGIPDLIRIIQRGFNWEGEDIDCIRRLDTVAKGFLLGIPPRLRT